MSRHDGYTWKEDLLYSAVLVGLITIPVLGVVLTILYNNPWWLWLLLPLIILQEAGIGLVLLIVVMVSFFMAW